MKKRLFFTLALLAFLPLRAEWAVRVNLAGYLPDDVKVAVAIAPEQGSPQTCRYEVVEAA